MSTPRKKPRGGVPQGVSVYQLKITLAHVEPPVWRRVRMPGTVALSLFHRFLQAVMGWRNMHLHRFIIAGRALGPVGHADEVGAQDLLTLAQAVELGGTGFRYDYDFGDDWQHRIEVEDVRSSPAATPTPVCVEGGRACPPEDCGGPGGYTELLETLRDPGHQRLKRPGFSGGPIS